MLAHLKHMQPVISQLINLFRVEKAKYAAMLMTTVASNSDLIHAPLYVPEW